MAVTIVEPPGYALTSFVAAVAIVGGVGLAPAGLLLVLTGFGLSVVEARRFAELNPGLARNPELLTQGAAKQISKWSLATLAGLAAIAYVLVSTTELPALVVIPAVVAGVADRYFNRRLRRALAKD